MLCVALVGPSSAHAVTLELAGHFGGVVTPPPPSKFPEEAQLGGANAMAVNRTGAGGVPAGTVYVATRGPIDAGGILRVMRFDPASGGLAFSESWEVRPVEGAYERCGPSVATECASRPEAPARAVSLAVDQASGNVYVFSTERLAAGDSAVGVFTADGSELLARFGVLAPSGSTTAATPGLIHNSPPPGGISVDGATVYVYDLNSTDNFYHRLMTFKESTAGNPKTYAYVSGGDIGAGFLNEGEFPTAPATDNAGHIYVAGESYVQEYSAAQPKTPICKFAFKPSGITAMAINPATGEPYFYTYKDKLIHHLSACSEGKFVEIPPTVSVQPERSAISAMAFDPSRLFEAGREPGVLYAAAAESVSNSGGKGQPGMGGLGYIFAPVKELAPVVESESVSGVGPTSAKLEAEINPKGSLTAFRFQYITEAAYLADGSDFGAGTIEAPPSGRVLGGGQEPLHAAATLSGLLPDITYLYRSVASSNCSVSEPAKLCSATGETHSFHTYASVALGLSDGRVWELVSPPFKDGGQVLPAEPTLNSCGLMDCKPGGAYTHFPVQSAPNGNAIVYEGTPFGSGGAAIENEYIARRGAGGWTTTDLTPPVLQSKGIQGYKEFNDELDEAILEQTSPSLSPLAPAGYANLYRQSIASPLQLQPLLTTTPPNRAAGFGGKGSNVFETTYAGSSDDFSHQIFEANDALTSATDSAPESVAGSEAENNLYEWAGGDLRLVNVLPGNAETVPGAAFGSGTLLKSGEPNSLAAVVTNAISADGSRIFWTSKAGQLYVREDGRTTVPIADAGRFLTASPDGSKVLLSDGCLYELASAECVDLTAGLGGFLGLVGQSDDLSHLYFADSAVLTGEEQNGQGGKAQVGKPNLYDWSEGEVSFVTILLESDNHVTEYTGDWQASPAYRSAEASPGGNWLAFVSTARLTGVPNVGPCQIVGETGEYVDAPCAEVFLYDSKTGDLRCASCNSTGAAPHGRSALRSIKAAVGSLPQPRYLTDAGRLYFDSQDSLSYLDTNGNVEDVYQYEPEGVGSCATAGGCVSLISAGRGPVDSNFLAMDATGDNVFFTTRDRLVPADGDELIDLYDARVGGSSAGTLPSAPCQGESCQQQGSAPSETGPTSQAARDVENFPQPPCPKGKVRRNGHCVKKKQHHKKAKKKHHAGGKHGGSK